MPQCCCVPGCREKNDGHRFPKDPELKMQWCVAIKRVDTRTKKLWMPAALDVVCHKHFTSEDYQPTLMGQRKRLKKGAVPSIFSFNKEMSESSRKRSERMRKKEQKEEMEFEVPSVQEEIEVITPGTFENKELVEDRRDATSVDEEIQCQLISDSRYTIDNYINDPKAVQYYTGFDDYDHFMMFFHVVGPAAYNLKYQCLALEPKDQLFLTIMKLRQAQDDSELSLFFKISESSVSTIIHTWINFLFFQLSEIDFWPCKDLVQDYMPEDFRRKFGSTRVILDATEIPVQKPSNVNAQSATFSSYKHKNTLKTMIGCTPRGLISYVSDSYGGVASDRQIVERSELVQNKELFEKGDSIMADRGIMVQDLFAARDVHVNVPTMLKGKSQLEPEDVVKDRRIASKRIHIERLIGLTKRFKILTQTLPHTKLTLGSRIIYICFALTNFRKCIVSDLA